MTMWIYTVNFCGNSDALYASLHGKTYCVQVLWESFSADNLGLSDNVQC